MNVLTRYIALEVLKAYFIAILILLTFYNLFTFADEMGDIGKGEYGLVKKVSEERKMKQKKN